MELLLQSDFNCIGDVAKHCDLEKLCIAENEAIQFDLAQLFCDNWDEIYNTFVEVNEGSDDVDKINLINGGTYLGCGEKERKHDGIRGILTRYAYARYVTINGYSDTASGLKTKTNEFSMPVPLKELEQFADKYRNMGLILFKKTKNYMDCKDGNCGCGCSVGKCDGTKAKGYGFKSKNITKR